MTTSADLVNGARTLLRDFPHYFEIDEGPLNVLTIRLPHPLISPSSVQVYIVDPTATPPTPTKTDAWQLDERNGLLKLTDETYLGKRVIVSGYYFSWFSDAELGFHANHVVGEMSHYSGNDLDDYAGAEIEVIQLGTVVHALWSLALELSLDIDVSTPEGMFIPAHQRYQQVLQMLGTYEQQYSDKAGMLNMGLGALEIFRLRRVAYTTGRYVPVYREREYDDPRPPERLYPPIPYGGTPPESGSGDIVQDIVAADSLREVPSVEELAREGQDFGFGGWRPVGWSGHP